MAESMKQHMRQTSSNPARFLSENVLGSCSVALVEGNDISSGDSRGLSLGAGHTPGYGSPGGGNT
jgi:hypothetical protein